MSWFFLTYVLFLFLAQYDEVIGSFYRIYDESLRVDE